MTSVVDSAGFLLYFVAAESIYITGWRWTMNEFSSGLNLDEHRETRETVQLTLLLRNEWAKVYVCV